MTTLVANTFNWIGLDGLANWFKKINASIKQQRQVRQTINELSKLNDKELNDIGLCRGDIWWVANEVYFKSRDEVKTNPNMKGWV